jgi:polar amino acid transport system substrate-binding protein
MKKLLRPLVVASLLAALVACGPIDEGDGGSNGSGAAQGQECSADSLPLKQSGTLTAGTSYPYYKPFKSGPRPSPKGYEPDVVTEIAERLGLDEITWEIAPFESLYAPGEKPYDFSIDQISITPERAQVVDFSDPYYLIQQGLLVREDTPIENAQSVEDLKQYKFGAQAGTTGLAYIDEEIQPTEPPSEYNDTNDAAQALSVGQIDAVVIDVPIAIPLTDQFPGTTVAGQFETNEGYGMAFPQKGSDLLPCVNDALADMEQDGTLQRLQNKWLPELNIDIPVLE